MPKLDQSQWDRFKAIHRDFYDQVAGTEVIWKRLISNIDRWAEGETDTYEEITLKAIVAFNDFRTWPINMGTVSGTVDKENIYLLLNETYLDELGFLNDNRYFDFNPSLDRFMVNGQIFYPLGDTPVAQTFNSVGYFMIILSREPVETGASLR